ncbi:MAG TPA: nucleotide exchange factor GrpE [Steroidobacteraceae bacterium]
MTRDFQTDSSASLDPAATDPQATVPAEVERLTAELAAAQAKAQENWDTYLRSMAEMENVRKRAQREVEAAQRYAVERFAGDLLEVRDSLELGIAAGSGTEAGKLVEGMEATLRLLNKAFEKAGVALIDPAGQAFNPEFHEAMVTQPTAEQPPGTVLAVVQKGYSLNGRLLRPARVVIARAPEGAA